MVVMMMMMINNDGDVQDTGDQAGDTVQWGESSESLGGAQLR